MPPPFETLEQVVFTDMSNFLAIVNRNFATIQNSPQFKGIPGASALPGDIGPQGLRGAKFVFVDYQRFNTVFPNELTSAAQIDIIYLNNKLLTPQSHENLLDALSLTELVDKDVIVLSNTMMLSYDYNNNTFINTNIAFNEQTNLLNTINQIIEEKIQEEMALINQNNQIIFQTYNTLGKNYSDNNSQNVTNNLTSTSVYSPFIAGFSPNSGIPIGNHKFISFADDVVSQTMNKTVVIGSIKNYYTMLQNTIDTQNIGSLSSNYAPGVNNIPPLVLLQDTQTAGILFGYKERPHFKSFGSIFKNANDEIEIKSDSGVLVSEYSSLLLSKSYLKYSKQVFFGNNLEVSRNVSVFGEINHKSIKSGGLSTNQNISDIDFGNTDAGAVVRIKSDLLNLDKYISNVLVTNALGETLKTYSIETADLTATPNLDLIPATLNSRFKVLTSYYYAYLANKINTITNYVKDNYWRRDQWNTGVIPSLKLSTSFDFVDILIGSIAANNIDRNLTIKTKNTYDNSENKQYQHFKDLVFVTDANGNLLKTYKIEKHSYLPSEAVVTGTLTLTNPSTETTNILTSNYYNHLATKINNIQSYLLSEYWKKSEFNTGVIPSLKLNDSLDVAKTTILRGEVLSVSKKLVEVSGHNLFLGEDNTTSIELKTNKIKFSEFTNNVLTTNSSGELINTYSIETALWNNTELDAETTVTDTVVSDVNKIPKSNHLQYIIRKINNIVINVRDNFWKKTEFNTGVIPSLFLSNTLRAAGNVIFGNQTTPNISTNGVETSIGSAAVNSILNLNGDTINTPFLNKVLVTDLTGKILNTYEIETETIPYSDTQAELDYEYWDTDSIGGSVYPFPTNINSRNKVLTSWYFNWIMMSFEKIRKMLHERPTFTDMYKHVPAGTCVLFMDTFDEGIPEGWIECNGQFIPNTSIRTPRLNDTSNNPLMISGVSLNDQFFGFTEGTNAVSLTANHMPLHTHSANSLPNGAHTHNFNTPFGNLDWNNVYRTSTAGNNSLNVLLTSNGNTQPSNSARYNNSYPLYFNNVGGGGGTAVDVIHNGPTLSAGAHTHTINVGDVNNRTSSQQSVPVASRRIYACWIMKLQQP